MKKLSLITSSGIVAKTLSLGAVASSKSLVLTCVHFFSSWSDSLYGFCPVFLVTNLNYSDKTQLIIRITIILTTATIYIFDSICCRKTNTLY